MPFIYLFIRYPFKNCEGLVLFTTQEMWCELGKQELYFPGIYNLLGEGTQSTTNNKFTNQRTMLQSGKCYAETE